MRPFRFDEAEEYSASDALRLFSDAVDGTCEDEGWPSDERPERLRRAREDFEWFCRAYFPGYMRGKGKSVFHEYAFKRLPRMLRQTKSQQLAVAAPRGEAKSTIASILFTIYCAVAKAKRCILIVSDSAEQAKMILSDVKAELDGNERLMADYPAETGVGPSWQKHSIVTNGGTMIKAVGATTRVRGLRFGSHRPDLLILDDLENDQNVASVEQRDKLERQILSSFVNLGGRGEKFDIVYLGSLLGSDSVLSRIIKNPKWDSRVFSAIVSWPSRMDLWDQWESIALESGSDAARAFYKANEKDMLAGSAVSWPGQTSLYALMERRLIAGKRAFEAEYQNKPIATQGAIFDSLTSFEDMPENPDQCDALGAIDPSLGGKNGDPSAILVGYRSRKTGRLFVTNAEIARRQPSEIIERALSLNKTRKVSVWRVESVQFQEFFAQELAGRGANEGNPINVKPWKSSERKESRIEALEPYISNGRIQTSKRLGALNDQLRAYPEVDHDDGADALAMLWGLAMDTRRREISVGGVANKYADDWSY